MKAIRWLVFDIGCIECGEPSGVVGIYTTKTEAKEVAEKYADQEPAGQWGRPEWSGQHRVEVFEITVEVDRN